MKTIIELQEEYRKKMEEEARELKAKQDALVAEAKTHLQALLAPYVALDGLTFQRYGIDVQSSTVVIKIGIEGRRFMGLSGDEPRFRYTVHNDTRSDDQQVTYLLDTLVYPPNWAKTEGAL